MTTTNSNGKVKIDTLEYANNNLVISHEDFLKGYNWNFTRFIKVDYSGQDYLPWSICFKALKELFPTYHVEVEKKEYVENRIADRELLLTVRNELKDKLNGIQELSNTSAIYAEITKTQKELKETEDAEARSTLESKIADLRSRLKGCDDYKEKKRLNTQLDNITNQLAYGDRGTIIYPRILDLASGKATPSIQFPIMDKTNDSAINPDSRSINDGTQRGLIKAIAVFTGIGYRLFTREGIDLDINDKRSGKNHPKFKALTRINQLVDLAETGGLLPDSFVEPHFGMSMFEINAIGKELAEIANNNTPYSVPQPAYESWKKPQDCLEWAKEILGMDDETAVALLKDTEADESGSKKIPFYNRVMELSK